MTNEHVNPERRPEGEERTFLNETPDFSKKPPRRRRSSLKRQRRFLLIAAVGVALLAVACALVLFFTARETFKDVDGAKYYILKRDGAWVMENEEKERLYQDADSNYITRCGTVVMVDAEKGEYKVVAHVDAEDGEQLSFSYVNGEYDILLYPKLERYDEAFADKYRIRSIRVHNEKGSFGFKLNSKNEYVLDGHSDVRYDELMLATLAYCTGTPRAMLRITPDVVAKYTLSEYGLDDPKAHYQITSNTGEQHTVWIGDRIPSGEGYYVRYEGRNSVYILSELSETEYNTTFSNVLLNCKIEDYVLPQVTVEMTSTNYFDVSDFKLFRMQDLQNFTGNLENATPFVTFSYEPIELRRGTFKSHIPYEGTGELDGYAINTFRADDCLLSLQELVAGKTVWLNSTENPLTLTKFQEKYGVAFAVYYKFNVQRHGEDKNYGIKEQVEQRIWISALKEGGVYYMYNEMFGMVVEVSREAMEFVEWSKYEWVDNDIFTGNVGYLQKMEVLVKNGTTAGITGITKMILNFDNKAAFESENGYDSGGNVSSVNMKVYAKYGASLSNPGLGEQIDTIQASRLYQSLLYSSLAGPTGLSEQEQDDYRATGDDGAMLVLKLTYYDPSGGGKQYYSEYRFYDIEESARQCFVTVNGKGSFYMEQIRVNKLVRDLGRVLITDGTQQNINAIDPLATIE